MERIFRIICDYLVWNGEAIERSKNPPPEPQPPEMPEIPEKDEKKDKKPNFFTAKNVIILGKSLNSSVCKFDYQERRDRLERGNANTIKTLVQVAQITADEKSADNQTIVVEVEDEWTLHLVERIVEHKERLGKCNIVPVPVNQILGQVLSQFSIMPELNAVYSELFSNKGAEFFCVPHEKTDDVNGELKEYLDTHTRSIPMTIMETKSGNYEYFVADEDGDVADRGEPIRSDFTVEPNPDYWLEQCNVVIIGHNSKVRDIIQGFDRFSGEWNREGKPILNVMIIDDEKNLEKQNRYRKIPYINQVVDADVYDYDKISKNVLQFIRSNTGDTSVLILSDDTVPQEDIDSSALTYLIYMQDIIRKCVEDDPSFDRESVDVVVEILNPKNYDVAHNYSADNVVISNRYISKMVTQISTKVSLYEFYCDILTYDEEDADEYKSKELYIKKAKDFYQQIPGPCTAAELIRATYEATPENDKAILLGYTSPNNKMVLFTGDQNKIQVRLTERDKLIMFCNH